MATKSQRPKERKDALPSLNVAINTLNLAKEASTIAPAEAAFDSTSVLLIMIKDSMVNEVNYVKLGLACAGTCEVLDQKTRGRRVDQLSPSVLRAVEQLTTIVAAIRRNIVKRGERNPASRLFHRKSDHEAIATWRADLNEILRVFNTKPEINAHVTSPVIHHGVPNTRPVVSGNHRNKLKSREDTSGRNPATHASAPGLEPQPSLSRNTRGNEPDIRHHIVKTGAIISEVHRNVINTHAMVYNILKNQEEADNQDRSAQNSTCGELPPPPPRIFSGRDELIEKIVDLTERLTPIALIGPGGIGKTSIALTVLHDNRVKRRFFQDRRFIRCDEFSPSLPHFLRRLSKAIGSGIGNPEDLTHLRPFLSSVDMLIVLDNAESILDPRGTDAQEIYAVVEELSQMSNICLFITSRISTVPPDFESLDVPTLSMGAACDTFYQIYKRGKRSRLITNIIRQLDLHPLSITLLATVAQQNKWGTDRLANEWDKDRTDMLQTEHNKSLAATIELSLSSPMFQGLGPNARELLGVVAFFPKGVDENNIGWLFPTVVGRRKILDKLCVLSLTYRNDGFITMLAPVRDYLSPKDPMSASLLRSTKERYFSRLSVDVEPDRPGFEEARWIVSEDVNVERLLNVFAITDATSASVCADFMKHLYWHKPRLVTLGPRIEALPDDHPSKLECLFQLSQLFSRVGNSTERKRLLTYTLELSRERGDDHRLAQTLRHLSRTNLAMRLHEEGIRDAEEASEISERLGDTAEQAQCLIDLAWLLYYDKQLDAAQEVAFRAIHLPKTGKRFLVCRCHHVLGEIYRFGGKTEKAIQNFEMALGIAPSSWSNQLFWIHFSMATLFFDEGKFGNAHAHVEHAKSHAVNHHDTFLLAHAMWLQAAFWHRQGRFEEAKSEALRALDVFEQFGDTKDAQDVRRLFRQIEGDRPREDMDDRVAPDESSDDGEFFETVLLIASIDSLCSDGTESGPPLPQMAMHITVSIDSLPY